METIELIGSLLLSFILFCFVGTLATVVLSRILFKRLTDEELERFDHYEATSKPKPLYKIYTHHNSEHRRAS